MPTGFELAQEHWNKAVRFVGEKAREDGIVDDREIIDLIRQWWNFLADEAALDAHLAIRDTAQKTEEIKRLKARLAVLEPAPGRIERRL